MAETTATTIRLTDTDRENAEAIVRLGAASDMASAIRVGLALGKVLLEAPGQVVRTVRDKDGQLVVGERLPSVGTARSIETRPNNFDVRMGESQRVAARVWSTAGPVVASAEVEWHVSPVFMGDVVRRADGGTFFVAKRRVGAGRLWATYEDLESERMEFRVVPEGFRGGVGPR